MSKSNEWEALNRIWKTLSLTDRERLYDDFKLVHSAIKKAELVDSQTLKNNTNEDFVVNTVCEFIEHEDTQTMEEDLLKRNDVLKLKLNGAFFEGLHLSAIVLSNLFGYKLIEQNNIYKTGFPSCMNEECIRVIEQNEISYISYGPGGEIYQYKDFKNNQFNKYTKVYITPNQPQKISWINPGDCITILDITTQEELQYRVEDSYLKYELSNNKDRFGNYKYQKHWDSSAKLDEGSINIQAPIIQALKGVKEGQLFEVTVGDNKTKYKLISIKRASH